MSNIDIKLENSKIGKPEDWIDHDVLRIVDSRCDVKKPTLGDYAIAFAKKYAGWGEHTPASLQEHGPGEYDFLYKSFPVPPRFGLDISCDIIIRKSDLAVEMVSLSSELVNSCRRYVDASVNSIINTFAQFVNPYELNAEKSTDGYFCYDVFDFSKTTDRVVLHVKTSGRFDRFDGVEAYCKMEICINFSPASATGQHLLKCKIESDYNFNEFCKLAIEHNREKGLIK